MKSSRTPIYPSAPKKGSLGPQDTNAPPALEVDGYLDKLAKYVPGEILVGFIPLYTLISTEFKDQALDIAHYVLLGACALVSIGYAWIRKLEPLPWFFYVLTVPAFFGWAIGTSTIAETLWGWTDGISKLALIGCAMLIPFLDELATKLLLKPKA